MRPAQTNLEFLRQLHEAGADDTVLLQLRRDYQTATRLFGDRMRGNGKPFLCHLVGTASMLFLEGADLTTIRAGLLHAAYSHGRFASGRQSKRENILPAHRRWLREQTGDAVEEIVHAYGRFRFNRQAVQAALAGEPADGDVATLMKIRICNEVDDILDYGAPLSGKKRYRDPQWLPLVMEYARAAGMDLSMRLIEEGMHDFAQLPASLQHSPEFRPGYHPPGLQQAIKDKLRYVRGSRFR